MKELKNKVAVVTGAGNGIGRSIALALGKAGVHVVVADLQEHAAKKVASELTSLGVQAQGVFCDVSREQDVASLADASYAKFGRVDILCNNAGVSWRPFRSVADATLDDWRFIYGVNLWGVLHGLDAFLPRMRKQSGEKHIVNTASLGGLFPMSGHAPYSSSKAAVVSLSEAMAIELAQYGFGVTILVPGRIPTDLRVNSALARCQAVDAVDPSFDPVPMPMKERFGEFAVLDSVDAVGEMVRNAILDNTLYLHTRPIPSDLLIERSLVQYGRTTIGRTS